MSILGIIMLIAHRVAFNIVLAGLFIWIGAPLVGVDGVTFRRSILAAFGSVIGMALAALLMAELFFVVRPLPYRATDLIAVLLGLGAFFCPLFVIKAVLRIGEVQALLLCFCYIAAGIVVPFLGNPLGVTIAAIAVAVWFFWSARAVGKSGIGWAFAGALALLVPSIPWTIFATPVIWTALIIPIVEYAPLIGEVAGFVAPLLLGPIALVGIGLGLGVVFWVHWRNLRATAGGDDLQPDSGGVARSPVLQGRTSETRRKLSLEEQAREIREEIRKQRKSRRRHGQRPRPGLPRESQERGALRALADALSRWRSWHFQTWLLIVLICIAVLLAPGLAWEFLRFIWRFLP